MSETNVDFKRQMQRQSAWLRESVLWLLDEYILHERAQSRQLKALEVGCGSGSMMDIMLERMIVKGVDIDPDLVHECRLRGLDASVASGENLPFEDATFDLAYCSFLLLWVKDPVRIISEMKRVSREWVVCLAEPDFGGRLSYPKELDLLDEAIIDGIKHDGGDPFVGRKIREIFARCGMNAAIGVHPGIWSIDKLREESEDEWRWVKMTINAEMHGADLESTRRTWDGALKDGSLFQFNPIFYALAKK